MTTYSHLKNTIEITRLTTIQAPIAANAIKEEPRPEPSIIIALSASPIWVEGSPFEITIRKSGIILLGKKMPPRNKNMKNTIIQIGVALLTLLIILARANPMLKKHIDPAVSTSQK